MKIERIKDPNWKRGFMRLYIVIWVFWASFLLISEYKAVLTSIGFDYWSESAYIQKRSVELRDEGCDKSPNGIPNDVGEGEYYLVSADCEEFYETVTVSTNPHLPLFGVISPAQAENRTTGVLKLGFLLPMILLVMLTLLGKGIAWVFRGFSVEK